MTRAALTAEHSRRVRDAVARAEAGTSGEIVTIVARRSDAYHDVGLHWAILATFLTIAGGVIEPAGTERFYIAILGGWHAALPLRLFLLMLLGETLTVFLAFRFLLAVPAVRMLATPGATRTRRVHRRAVTLFRAAAEARTTGRTGVLIYLSMDEHRAEIVADSAITARVAPEAWGDALAALLAAAKAGRIGDGLVRAVQGVGAILAEHLPAGAANPNELPDRLIEL